MPPPASRGPLLVAVVSERAVVRHGVTAMLNRAADVRVHEDRDAGSLPDVVLYDLVLLDRYGEADLVRLVRGPSSVVGFEVYSRPDLVQRGLSLGMADSVPPDVDVTALRDHVRRAADGLRVSADDRREQVRAEVRRRYGITDREASILALIAAGLRNQEIADHLYLSINSVKTYIRSLYARIGVTSRPEAVMWAVRHSLAEGDPRPSAQVVQTSPAVRSAPVSSLEGSR